MEQMSDGTMYLDGWKDHRAVDGAANITHHPDKPWVVAIYGKLPEMQTWGLDVTHENARHVVQACEATADLGGIRGLALGIIGVKEHARVIASTIREQFEIPITH